MGAKVPAMRGLVRKVGTIEPDSFKRPRSATPIGAGAVAYVGSTCSSRTEPDARASRLGRNAYRRGTPAEARELARRAVGSERELTPAGAAGADRPGSLEVTEGGAVDEGGPAGPLATPGLEPEREADTEGRGAPPALGRDPTEAATTRTVTRRAQAPPAAGRSTTLHSARGVHTPWGGGGSGSVPSRTEPSPSSSPPGAQDSDPPGSPHRVAELIRENHRSLARAVQPVARVP